MNVAYVEDDEDFLEWVAEDLVACGCNVRTFSNADSLFDYGLNNFDLIIFDRLLGNFDIVEKKVALACREFGFSGKIILYSNNPILNTSSDFDIIIDKCSEVEWNKILERI